MSTYRYARDSKTSAQKAARQWELDVEMLKDTLAGYERYIAAGHQLSQYDAMLQRNATRKLAKLLAENPNEPA